MSLSRTFFSRDEGEARKADSLTPTPQKAVGTPGNHPVTAETVNSGFKQSPSYVRGSSVDSQAKQAPMQQDTDKPDMARRSGTSAQPSVHSRGVPIDSQAETLVSNNRPISTGSGANAQAPMNVRGAPTSHMDQSSVLSDPVVTGKRATTMRSGTYTQPSGSVRGVSRSQAEWSSESLAASEHSMAERSNTIAQSSGLLNNGSQYGHSRTIDSANKYSEKSSVTPNNAFEVVGVDDLGKEDVIIAIMGPTGSGKSLFVSKASGTGGDGVGHSLQSYTSEIRATRCTIGETSIVLLDTPGFDDTMKTDLQILESIADWLRKTYKEGALLSGLLYFHRITDNRMAGTPLKNLKVFRQLCGNDAMSQIVLTTTMWDEVDEKIGIERLEGLEENYWKVMIQQGSRTFRYLNTQESAKELLQLVAKKRPDVRLQKEIGDKHMELRETSAGQELHSHLDQLAASQMQVLERLRAQLKDGPTEDLRKESEAVKAQLDDTQRQPQVLKLQSMQRTMAFVRRRIGL